MRPRPTNPQPPRPLSLVARSARSSALVRAFLATIGIVGFVALASPVAEAQRAGRAKSGPRPNILFLTADTTRKDQLGHYGFPFPTSPNIDRLARRSHVFDRFVSASNNTSVSFASMHTGLHMKTHKVYYLAQFGYRLGDGFRTLAQVLDDEGYTTAAAVSIFHLNDSYSGFGRGFDVFVDCETDGYKQPGDTTNDLLFRALGPVLEEKRDAPLFLWAHYFDAHAPYSPPEPLEDMFQGARIQWGETPQPKDVADVRKRRMIRRKAENDARYAGELRFLDSQVGRLLDWLDERGRLDDLLVVFTADHGENLGEHMLYANHNRVYRPVTEVPLFVMLPGQREFVSVRAPAHTVDLLPTVLDYLDLESEAPEGLEGTSLLPAMGDAGGSFERELFVEGRSNLEKAIVANGHKLTYRFSPHLSRDDSFELYDIIADPGETTNLWHREESAGIRRSLERSLGDFIGAREIELGFRSVDGEEHRVEAWMRPVKGTGIELVPERRDVDSGERAELAAGGRLEVDARVGGRRTGEDPDEDSVVAALDWSGAVACWFRVDRERPPRRRELSFAGVPNVDMGVRYFFPFGDRGASDRIVSPGSGAWTVSRRRLESGDHEISVEFHGIEGREDAPFRFLVNSTVEVRDLQGFGGMETKRAYERIEGTGTGRGRATFVLEERATRIVGTFFAGGRASGPDQIHCRGGFDTPAGMNHPGIFFSPWFSLRRKGEGGVADPARPPVVQIEFRTEGQSGGTAELDDETRRRLEALGYKR